MHAGDRRAFRRRVSVTMGGGIGVAIVGACAPAMPVRTASTAVPVSALPRAPLDIDAGVPDARQTNATRERDAHADARIETVVGKYCRRGNYPGEGRSACAVIGTPELASRCESQCMAEWRKLRPKNDVIDRLVVRRCAGRDLLVRNELEACKRFWGQGELMLHCMDACREAPNEDTAPLQACISGFVEKSKPPTCRFEEPEDAAEQRRCDDACQTKANEIVRRMVGPPH
jgi:hypothetical protein